MAPDPPLRGRSIFVTGAYGLLGSWLTAALLERGATVTALRRDTVPVSALSLAGLEPRVQVVDGDVRDGALLERALAEYEIDTVFHLAAQTLVGVARHSPVATFETNIRGTWSVLEACRRMEVTRVVVAASDKAYGIHEQLPYREDAALIPAFPYDVSKAAADLLARSYWHTYGLPVAVTRFANLYGGGDLNLSRLVPETALAIVEGRAPVLRSDGTLERDFLYVEDAVDAYLALLALLDEGHAGGEAFNAGSGRPRSVLELVRTMCALGRSPVAPDIRGTGAPPGEIPRQWLDCTKLREATGWTPRFSLEEGLTRTLRWYRDHAAAIAG